jgi:lysozyme family protein
MASNGFSAALAIILREEGGNDDDPRDHGGRTSRGITQREWDAFRANNAGRPSDVWKASQADIGNIYRNQYWNPYCDDLPAGVDLVFFNASVNSGRQQAVKFLQRAVGAKADGMMGMLTKNAVAAADPAEVVESFGDQYERFYRALKQFPIYGKGWLGRNSRVTATALKLANATPKQAAVAEHPVVDTGPENAQVTVSAKAPPTAVAEPPVSQETGVAVTTTSTVGQGIVGQLQDAVAPLSPYADTVHVVRYILIAIAIIGFGLTIYAIWHNHQTKAAVA